MSWSHPLAVESPRIGHAPPQHLRKRWPLEALMEGWFPLRSGEHASLPIAEVAGSRENTDDRIQRALPADPAAVLSRPRTQSRVAAVHRAAMRRGVDAGCHCTCMPATVKVCLDIRLHGRTSKRPHRGVIVARLPPRVGGTHHSRTLALHARRDLGQLIHHSDRGCQYLAIRYTDRLIEAGIKQSVGTTGDSYDNALAETINGLFKTEVIYFRGPWRSLEAVEFATMEWVDWFNNRRLLEPIGNVPPVEFERAYHLAQKAATEAHDAGASHAEPGDHEDAGGALNPAGWGDSPSPQTPLPDPTTNTVGVN